MRFPPIPIVETRATAPPLPCGSPTSACRVTRVPQFLRSVPEHRDGKERSPATKMLRAPSGGRS